jgi:hypothetical protein
VLIIYEVCKTIRNVTIFANKSAVFIYGNLFSSLGLFLWFFELAGQINEYDLPCQMSGSLVAEFSIIP